MYYGSCLCKKVTFEVDGEFKGFFFCHCSRCRKVTGSAHGANLFSADAKLTWKSGKEHVKTFRLPDTRFAKSFCDICSSAMPTLDQGRLLVPAGSLDSDVNVVPTAHICMSSKANWEQNLENVAKFPGLPE